jgi:hypothetical protein
LSAAAQEGGRRSDFDLIEIEGDAAFLSREADPLNGDAMLGAVTDAVGAMHRAFHVERRLVELTLCRATVAVRRAA